MKFKMGRAIRTTKTILRYKKFFIGFTLEMSRGN